MRASVHATLILLIKVNLWGDKKYALANFTNDELVAAAQAVAPLGSACHCAGIRRSSVGPREGREHTVDFRRRMRGKWVPAHGDPRSKMAEEQLRGHARTHSRSPGCQRPTLVCAAHGR